MNIQTNKKKNGIARARKSLRLRTPCRGKEKSLEELVKEQRAKPIADLSLISGGWEDVDVDAFLREVRSHSHFLHHPAHFKHISGLKLIIAPGQPSTR